MTVEIHILRFVSDSLQDTYTGTFLRLGKYIDFSNHRQLIKEEIASKLNKWEPQIRRHRHDIDSSNPDCGDPYSQICI
jgi:hypothetical protein